VSIKLRDKRSGAVRNWPHWADNILATRHDPPMRRPRSIGHRRRRNRTHQRPSLSHGGAIWKRHARVRCDLGQSAEGGGMETSRQHPEPWPLSKSKPRSCRHPAAPISKKVMIGRTSALRFPNARHSRPGTPRYSPQPSPNSVSTWSKTQTGFDSPRERQQHRKP